MPALERTRVLRTLSTEDAERVLHDWRFWARPEQVVEYSNDYIHDLILAGRGFGKTWMGSQKVNDVAEHHAEECAGQIGILGRTAAAVRREMIGFPAGILATSKPWFRPKWEPSKSLITWPNGVMGHTMSADKLEQGRGPNLGFLWMDELPHFQDPQGVWDTVIFGLRLGRPRSIITTTPLPIDLIRELVEASNVRVTAGSTYDNRANLAPEYFEEIIKRFEGTRLGRQELLGEVLEDNPDALWKREFFRYIPENDLPVFDRVLIGLDPGGPERDNDETGIVAVGLAAGAIYVLEDGSGNFRAPVWARRAVSMAIRWGAHAIVCETPITGLVKLAIEGVDSHVRVEEVRAKISKASRATPVALIWEKNRAFHVGDGRQFPELESQLCRFNPRLGKKQKSPDRMDALVWGVLGLIGETSQAAGFRALADARIWEAVRAKLGG